MRLTDRTAKWTVAPNESGVILAINGIGYGMSVEEAFALSELVDEAAVFVNARNREDTP
jgi:Holliday junction resolvasome RuvABC DNA-binding subunit